LVALGEHTMASEYCPSIDLFINDVRQRSLEFVVNLAIELKGFQLEIKDSKIRRIRTGSWSGSGNVTLGGLEIYKKELEPVALPGVVELGQGWPIGGTTSADSPSQSPASRA
jgi:hypothetical protein